MGNLFESTEQSLREEVQEKVHKIADLKSENARLTKRYGEAITALGRVVDDYFVWQNAPDPNHKAFLHSMVKPARALIAKHDKREEGEDV